ncbi:hypothetical protein HIM_09238 [Hirsutella minnesotensis 3608]|uniref:Uncharacterized protein n=1 Tax=Hirsutella minnesotensis 3608 TaxID=1043627 RepID=A0A0F7ZLQ9_9HYPO|nr:hypothetical protein HIM_09238 [Hirsutella minnesotensis 3608]
MNQYDSRSHLDSKCRHGPQETGYYNRGKEAPSTINPPRYSEYGQRLYSHEPEYTWPPEHRRPADAKRHEARHDASAWPSYQTQTYDAKPEYARDMDPRYGHDSRSDAAAWSAHQMPREGPTMRSATDTLSRGISSTVKNSIAPWRLYKLKDSVPQIVEGGLQLAQAAAFSGSRRR